MFNKILGGNSSDAYAKASNKLSDDVMYQGGVPDDDYHVCYQLIDNPVELEVNKGFYDNLIVGTTSDAKKLWPEHEAMCIKEKLDVGPVCQWKHLIETMKNKTLDIENSKAPKEKVVVPKDNDGKTLGEGNKGTTCGQTFYPTDTPNKFVGKDVVRETSILNNDTTSFVVFDFDDESKTLTRTPALEDIVKKSVNLKKDRRRTLGTWGNPPRAKIFSDNGNNCTVFNKLIKNVFIRWDADLVELRNLFGWSKDPTKLKETKENNPARAGEVMSEVIICYNGSDGFIRIKLP